VDPDGQFALALPVGTYEVPAIEIQADDLATQPVRLPLTATETLRFEAPATGCVYTGQVHLLYGRLPVGDLKQQSTVLGQLDKITGGGYVFVYLPSGGLVVTGGKLDVPPTADRPTAARNCPVREFTSVPS